MGITINGFETRFQKPKFGGENPFKSAKPFDDNIDYNSLEDGDLFYIESKEGFVKCEDGLYSFKVEDPLTKDIIHTFVDEYDICMAQELWDNAGPAYPLWNFELNLDHLHIFFVKEGGGVSNAIVGVFFKPQYCCNEDITIPTCLSKQDFIYWKEQLPTIVLGEVIMNWYSTSGTYQIVLPDTITTPCLFGNKILSYRVLDGSKTIQLVTYELDENNYTSVTQMMPIYVLKMNSHANSDFNFSVDRDTLQATVTLQNEGQWVIQIEGGELRSGSYSSDVRNNFISRYQGRSLDSIYASKCYYDVIQQYLQNTAFYSYVFPEKLYIIYNNGVFTPMIESRKSVITAKSYLKILEYFEEYPDSDMTFSTYEFFQLFNVKPIAGGLYIGTLINSFHYGTYVGLQPVFDITFVDQDHVKITLSEGYDSSASSQELSIGEFEE